MMRYMIKRKDREFGPGFFVYDTAGPIMAPIMCQAVGARAAERICHCLNLANLSFDDQCSLAVYIPKPKGQANE